MARASIACHSIADLREAARRRLPRLFFDYIDGGSHSEITMRHNELDFRRWRLVPRALSNVESIDLGCEYLGRRNALPFMLAPVGYLGMLAPGGDIAAGAAAADRQIPVAISTFSIACMEAIAEASGGRAAYQIYMFRDRALCTDMLARARSAGMTSLLVTVDTPITPMRVRDARNGFRATTRLRFGQVLDFARHPRWSLDMLRSGSFQVGNVDGYDMGSGILEQSGRVARAIDPSFDWEGLGWLRSRWPGRLYVKGIVAPDDAARCCDLGADGIILSNHGGRQLDFAPSTITMLPRVRDKIGDRAEIILDGGIRRGSDIVMALALGADGVAIGRAYAYGLGAFGEAGLRRAIDLLAGELASTLALMGHASIASLKAAPLCNTLQSFS